MQIHAGTDADFDAHAITDENSDAHADTDADEDPNPCSSTVSHLSKVSCVGRQQAQVVSVQVGGNDGPLQDALEALQQLEGRHHCVAVLAALAIAQACHCCGQPCTISRPNLCSFQTNLVCFQTNLVQFPDQPCRVSGPTLYSFQILSCGGLKGTRGPVSAKSCF